MLFVIAVILGILFGLIIPYNLTSDTLPYVAVAIIAALDSVFGGIVANFSKRFSIYVFMTGLISNAILAVMLTYVGNILGINLSFAVIIVFGVRLFNNLANIRRATIDRYVLEKVKLRTNTAYIGIEGGFDEDTEEYEDEEKEPEKESLSDAEESDTQVCEEIEKEENLAEE